MKVGNVMTWELDVSTPEQLFTILAAAMPSKICFLCRDSLLLRSCESMELLRVNRPANNYCFVRVNVRCFIINI